MQTEAAFINRIITFACAAGGAVLALGAAFVFYRVVVSPDTVGFGSVASLVLIGFAAFLGILAIFSLIFSWIGILDGKQAFGLPEGTVRAILTIAFIVIVGVLASYLITNSDGGAPIDESNSVVVAIGLSIADANAFVAKTTSADGILGLRPTATPTPSASTAPTPAPAIGTEARYDVVLYPRIDHRLKEDVSKQILTMLSTILAAMIGFYFGARPGESDPDAAKRAQAASTIERVKASLPDTKDLAVRAQHLVDTKLAGGDRTAEREKLVALKARLETLQRVIDDADSTRLSSSSTAIEMNNAAASATSAATDIAAAKATIESLERGT